MKVRKIRAPIKIKSALPPPPPKTPPKKGNFTDMVFPAERTHFFQVSIKLAHPFPAPELRTRILRTRGFFWERGTWQPILDWFRDKQKVRKRGGVQKSMGSKVSWKTGMLIYLPVTSRPLISLQKEAVLSLCNFATAHLTACILKFYLPWTSRPMKRRTLSQHPKRATTKGQNRLGTFSHFLALFHTFSHFFLSF